MLVVLKADFRCARGVYWLRWTADEGVGAAGGDHSAQDREAEGRCDHLMWRDEQHPDGLSLLSLFFSF